MSRRKTQAWITVAAALALFAGVAALLVDCAGQHREPALHSTGRTGEAEPQLGLGPLPRDERMVILQASSTPVTGTVVDTHDRAVPGAIVCVTMMNFGQVSGRPLHELQHCSETGPKGHFALDVPARGVAWIAASALGFLPVRLESRAPARRLTLSGAAIDSVVLRMRAGGAVVRGFVGDRFGGTIADAIVMASSGTPDGLPVGPRVKTDEEGRFALTIDPIADRVIGAMADGYAAGGTTFVASEGAEIEILLDPESRIEGSVVDGEGRGLVGVTVSVPNAPIRGSSISDERGRFAISGLPSGTYRPEATGAGVFGRSKTELDVEPGSYVEDVRIFAEPVGRIVASLEDELNRCGLPRIEAERDTDRIWAIGSTGGEAVLPVRESGSYEVWMSCDDRASIRQKVAVEVGQDVELEFVLPTPAGVTLSGTLTDDRGNPAVGQLVQLWKGEREVLSTGSDAAGTFSLHPVPAGQYTVTASGLRPEHGAGLEIDVGDADVVGVELTARQMAKVTVTVLQRDGSPYPNAEVRTRGGQRSYLCRADRRGICSIATLPAGSVEVFVSTLETLKQPAADAEPLVSRRVELAWGEDVALDLRVSETRSSIAGEVRAAGVPVLGARVTAGIAGDDDGDDVVVARAVTDVDGRFSLDGLPPAEYDVRVMARHGRVAERSGVEPDSHDLLFELEP